MQGKRNWQRVASALPVFVLVLAVTGTALGCPTCKESLAANDPHHQNLVAGYYYSILFMMSMPFILLSSFSGYMYLEVRRARARVQADSTRTELSR